MKSNLERENFAVQPNAGGQPNQSISGAHLMPSPGTVFGVVEFLHMENSFCR